MILSAWYGGLGPGVLAMGLGFLGCLYLFFVSPNEATRDLPGIALRLSLYGFVSASIIPLTERVRAAREKAAALAREQAAHAATGRLRAELERQRDLLAAQKRELEESIAERERVEEGLRFLSRASAVLASSLDEQTTLANVARCAVPFLADYCLVDLIEEGGAIRRRAAAHADPAGEEQARRLLPFPPDRSQRARVIRVLEAGRPEIHPEVTADDLAPGARNEEQRQLLQELAPRSQMIVPLVVRGRLLGALTFAFAGSGRRYSDAELVLAEELARDAALAFDNARTYRRQQEIARTLQQSLLPPVRPELPGMELWACYRAAGEAILVGGDFYDVFETPEHRWAVVIGDVSGKGPAAAVVTSLARHTLRAAAMRTGDPRQILAMLNEAMLRQITDDSFCTLQYLLVETRPGGARLTLTSAGHPPALVRRRDGRVETLGLPGTVLGFTTELRLAEQSVELRPGEAIVLYTDGVTEARTGGGDLFEEERLRALIAACAGLEARGIAERIEETILQFQHDQPRDDMAILVLQVPAAGPHPFHPLRDGLARETAGRAASRAGGVEAGGRREAWGSGAEGAPGARWTPARAARLPYKV